MADAPKLRAGAEEEVPLPADKVWEVIGDFANVRRWAPALLAERTEQSEAGIVRVISMPPDGREVRELLYEQGSFSYTYFYLGQTPNACNYYGTVSVKPLNASTSRIELLSRFDAVPGVTNEDAVANLTKSARGNLKAMKRALGLV
jgi:hypothetical protein